MSGECPSYPQSPYIQNQEAVNSLKTVRQNGTTLLFIVPGVTCFFFFPPNQTSKVQGWASSGNTMAATSKCSGVKNKYGAISRTTARADNQCFADKWTGAWRTHRVSETHVGVFFLFVCFTLRLLLVFHTRLQLRCSASIHRLGERSPSWLL